MTTVKQKVGRLGSDLSLPPLADPEAPIQPGDPQDAKTLADAALRGWLEAEYRTATAAARRAAAARRGHRDNPRALEHASATARICALGEVLRRLDGEPA